MVKLNHPLSRADYELQEDGSIWVVEGDKWGRFDADGYWLEGDLRAADPQMCRYIAGGAIMAQIAAKAARQN